MEFLPKEIWGLIIPNYITFCQLRCVSKNMKRILDKSIIVKNLSRIEFEEEKTTYKILIIDTYVLHRKDGPAIEHSNGSKKWYIQGKLHRMDGPAIEYPDGTKYWYFQGKHHREDGPATEYFDGSKFWYIQDRLHRDDGPAIERPDGRKEWYIQGQQQYY